jgi:hypothetical protein
MEEPMRGHPYDSPNGAKIDAIEGHLFHTREEIRLIAGALASAHAALLDLQEREKEEVTELTALGYQHFRPGHPRRLTESLTAAIRASKAANPDPIWPNSKEATA